MVANTNGIDNLLATTITFVQTRSIPKEEVERWLLSWFRAGVEIGNQAVAGFVLARIQCPNSRPE